MFSVVGMGINLGDICMFYYLDMDFVMGFSNDVYNCFYYFVEFLFCYY